MHILHLSAKGTGRSSYHNILNVMLNQVVLGGNEHRSAKCIQICVVQLVRHAINFVRCIYMNVPGEKWTERKK